MSASMKSAKAAAPYPDEGTSRKTQTFCRKERRLYLSGFILILLLLSVRLPDVTSFGMSVKTQRSSIRGKRRCSGCSFARPIPCDARFSTLGSVLVEREQHLVVQLEVDLDRVAVPHVVELEIFV